jgi:hypothetical protein
MLISLVLSMGRCLHGDVKSSRGEFDDAPGPSENESDTSAKMPRHAIN